MKKWKGPKSGISRVLACVTHELLSLEGVASKLCVFDESAATFRPFEAAEALYPDPHPSGVTDGGIRHHIKTRIKTAASSFDRKLPQDIKNPLRVVESDAYHLLVDSGRLALSVGRWLLRRRESPSRASSGGASFGVVRFSEDDVLLALSSTWEYRDYTEAVARLKHRSALKFVHVVYDLIPSKFPHFYPAGYGDEFQRWAVDVLRIADLLLAISANSKKDLELLSRQTGARCPPIDVIRLGDDVPSHRPSEPTPHVHLGEPFILCVGTIEARKNQALLYQVWSRLLQTYGASVPKLVIVGNPGLLASDFVTLVKDSAMRNHVVILKDTADSELVWLYEHCLFTVYPSIYEGWGLPVAESLARGKYCITSGSSSMPEIAGDLVDYHSPWDSGECYNLIAQALGDARFLNEREAAIRARYKRTSWKETAESIVRFVGRIGSAAGA